MNTIRKENSVRWYDWTLVALLAVVCALLFSSCDLLWTGNRSWLMLEGNPLTFYDRSYVWSGAHNANYMPTIFVLFALWNLPLKLLGVTAPAFEGEINLFLLQWYRVLPSLFMAGCTALVGRIALKMGMEKKKAILCTFAFITAPLIFHSLFIYGQYDTLGIFFTLLAIERWLQWEKPRNRVLFSLWMGVAITFKYFSLPVFFILLFLREHFRQPVLLQP